MLCGGHFPGNEGIPFWLWEVSDLPRFISLTPAAQFRDAVRREFKSPRGHKHLNISHSASDAGLALDL